LEELGKPSGESNQPVFWKLLHHYQNMNKKGEFPYLKMLIPPPLEKLIQFITTKVNNTQYTRHLEWILKLYAITPEVYFYLIQPFLE
jgi:hypothetical protein